MENRITPPLTNSGIVPILDGATSDVQSVSTEICSEKKLRQIIHWVLRKG